MRRALEIAALLVLLIPGSLSAAPRIDANAGIYNQGNSVSWYGEANYYDAYGNRVDVRMAGNLTLFQEQVYNGAPCCGEVIDYLPWIVYNGSWADSSSATLQYNYCYASAVVAQTDTVSVTVYSTSACTGDPPGIYPCNPATNPNCICTTSVSPGSVTGQTCCDPTTDPTCCDPATDPTCGCDPATDPTCCDPLTDPTCGCDPAIDPTCCDPAIDPTCGCDPTIDPSCGCDPMFDPSCGGGGGCDPYSDPNCVCDWTGCYENQDPVMINLRNEPWRLSGLNDPVRFDMQGTGHRITTAWTARNSSIAFLALDRNHNGTIDDGSELFGNAMRLASGKRAANGFEALAQYDANGDGVIDKRDPIWPSLLLWIDRNHDGVCQPDELTPLSASPVTSIGLSHRWIGRRDKSGNTYRYKGYVHMGSTVRPYFDVFFVWRR